MVFPDGDRRVGFFEFNVYKRPLENIDEYDNEIKKLDEKFKVPPEFKEEV